MLLIGPLQIAPRVGNMLGGTTIVLAGPCFNPEEDIICTFDGSITVTGRSASEVMALCVSPYFETRGWKDLTVTLWAGLELRYTGESRFYAGKFKVG